MDVTQAKALLEQARDLISQAEALLVPDEPPTAPVPAAPDAPGKPLAVLGVPGSRSLSLAWEPPASDGGAAIESYGVDDGTTILVVPPSQPSVVLTNLEDGKTYSYVVRAVNVVGASPPSDPSDPVTTPTMKVSIEGQPTVGSKLRAVISWITGGSS